MSERVLMSTESAVAVSTGDKRLPAFGLIAEGVTDTKLEVVESVLKIDEAVVRVEVVALSVVTEAVVLSAVKKFVELVVTFRGAGNCVPAWAML